MPEVVKGQMTIVWEEITPLLKKKVTCIRDVEGKILIPFKMELHNTWGV